jgi:uncharacterized membrane protein YfcA
VLFNIVAVPGALLRYRQGSQLVGPLTRRLVPGVVLGAGVRVFAVPGPREFRLVVAAVLLPLGLWLCARAFLPIRRQPSARLILALGVAAGTVGGIYGIGGGSILGPVLAGYGLPVAVIAPAALASDS